MPYDQCWNPLTYATTAAQNGQCPSGSIGVYSPANPQAPAYQAARAAASAAGFSWPSWLTDIGNELTSGTTWKELGLIAAGALIVIFGAALLLFGDKGVGSTSGL